MCPNSLSRSRTRGELIAGRCSSKGNLLRDRAKRLLREDPPDLFSPASWQWLHLVDDPDSVREPAGFRISSRERPKKLRVLYHLKALLLAGQARPLSRRRGLRHR